MPPEWSVSRICDEFKCVPSQAVRELKRNPDLVGRVMELRAYADAHHRFTHEKAEDGLNLHAGQDPMLDLVWEFYGERLRTDERDPDSDL